MPDRSTLLTRLAISQMAGLLIGLAGFELIVVLLPDADPLFRWGVLLWYPTMGAMIAVVDQLRSQGGLPWEMDWWVPGAIFGAWFNFVITFMAYGTMSKFLSGIFGAASTFASPFWFVAEGMAAGVAIAYLVMRFGGEGRGIGDD